jgi:hypothetical protein
LTKSDCERGSRTQPGELRQWLAGGRQGWPNGRANPRRRIGLLNVLGSFLMIDSSQLRGHNARPKMAGRRKPIVNRPRRLPLGTASSQAVQLAQSEQRLTRLLIFVVVVVVAVVVVLVQGGLSWAHVIEGALMSGAGGQHAELQSARSDGKYLSIQFGRIRACQQRATLSRELHQVC